MEKKYLIHACCAAGLFSLATPLSKILLNNDISPILLASLFYLGAAIFLIPFSINRTIRDLQIITKKTNDLWRMVGAIIFGGILGPIFLLFGIQLSHATTASLLLNLETAATAFLAVLLFKEHLGKKIIISSSITVVAGSLLVFNNDFQLSLGGILIALACLCWGFDNNFTATIESISPKTNTIIKGFIAGAFNLILAFLLGEYSINLIYLLMALMIGFFSYGLSIVLYITAARKLGATRSQIIFASNPFIAFLLSYLLLSDSLGFIFWISFSMMIIAIIMLYYENHNHHHAHPHTIHEHEHNHEDEHHDHDHPNDSNDKKGRLLKHTTHTHLHTHLATEHSHLHYPDIHHRHH